MTHPERAPLTPASAGLRPTRIDGYRDGWQCSPGGPLAQKKRSENLPRITTVRAGHNIHIGIPEGALDVKRALTGRAIFSRPKAGFCPLRAAPGMRKGALKRTPRVPEPAPDASRWSVSGSLSAKIARRRAAVKGGRRPSREGREDRRRSEAKPRTVAPLRADRRWATARAIAGSVRFGLGSTSRVGRRMGARGPSPGSQM